eukprot:30011-Chlamydomonas_euryale.AAC.2
MAAAAATSAAAAAAAAAASDKKRCGVMSSAESPWAQLAHLRAHRGIPEPLLRRALERLAPLYRAANSSATVRIASACNQGTVGASGARPHAGPRRALDRILKTCSAVPPSRRPLGVGASEHRVHMTNSSAHLTLGSTSAAPALPASILFGGSGHSVMYGHHGNSGGGGSIGGWPALGLGSAVYPDATALTRVTIPITTSTTSSSSPAEPACMPPTMQSPRCCREEAAAATARPRCRRCSSSSSSNTWVAAATAAAAAGRAVAPERPPPLAASLPPTPAGTRPRSSAAAGGSMSGEARERTARGLPRPGRQQKRRGGPIVAAAARTGRAGRGGDDGKLGPPSHP